MEQGLPNGSCEAVPKRTSKWVSAGILQTTTIRIVNKEAGSSGQTSCLLVVHIDSSSKENESLCLEIHSQDTEVGIVHSAQFLFHQRPTDPSTPEAIM